MRGTNWVKWPLAVLLMLLSLGSAPVVDALTHGPGTLAARADHAASQAETGGTLQADSRQHHDSTCHDPEWSLILVAQDNAIFAMRRLRRLGGIARQA